MQNVIYYGIIIKIAANLIITMYRERSRIARDTAADTLLQDASYAFAAPVMQLRTDAECIGALRSLQEGPLRVCGKRSSVCPGIKKGIPKASRQIDGEREGETREERKGRRAEGEGGKAEGEREEGRSKRKTMLLPVTAGHSGK